MVKYFNIEGVPGDYFECQSGMGTLSATACSKCYQEAMSPQGLKEGRRLTCRACPVGAKHAGVPEDADPLSRFVGSMICTRCERPARRLICGSICVSCYNRQREVLIGRNAKGTIPMHCRPVYSTSLACIFNHGSKTQIRLFDHVSSMKEARLSVLRNETDPCMFGWAPRLGKGM